MAGALWCAGVYASNQWSFVGKSFHSALFLLSHAYFGELRAEVAIEALCLGYCLLRLVCVVGPRSANATRNADTFWPDRALAVAFTLSNLEATCYFWNRPPQTGVWPLGHPLSLLVSLAYLSWFDVAVWQSKGWTLAIGAALCIQGTLSFLEDPRLPQLAITCFGILYFALRLAWIGPRPRGILGLASD